MRYTRAGYPVFSPYAEKTVVVDNLTGDRPADFAAANDAIGASRTPRGYVWHHVEDGRTLELVPKDLHEAVRHTGGVPAIKSHQVGQVAPGGVFTPFEQGAGIGGGLGGFGAGGPAAAQTGP